MMMIEFKHIKNSRKPRACRNCKTLLDRGKPYCKCIIDDRLSKRYEHVPLCLDCWNEMSYLQEEEKRRVRDIHERMEAILSKDTVVPIKKFNARN